MSAVDGGHLFGKPIDQVTVFIGHIAFLSWVYSQVIQLESVPTGLANEIHIRRDHGVR